MRKLLALLAVAALFAGCGDDDPAPQAATPAPTEAEANVHELELDGYSEGVKRYYGGAHVHEGGDELADIESEYHQPPVPPEAGVGETITLTGTNIGVRLEVTLDAVERAGDRTEARLTLKNTGIAVYEGPLQNAELTFGDGEPQPAVADEGCSRSFDPGHLRIDVDRRRRVCLLFDGAGEPERLQLALEVVPAEAGGIWNLD